METIHRGEHSMTQAKSNTWHDIPREQIQWNPSIVAERCVGCGMCVTSCGRGVYAFDYDRNQPVIKLPQMCMVGCTTCAAICTQDAIEFPSIGYIRHFIRKNKLLRQAKNKLNSNREKYAVTLPTQED
jgi:NAD-dependent dihydropyrimidine dehydrogenase PreA subunit